jgi:hypothetical protein
MTRRYRPPQWSGKDDAMRSLYGTPAEPVPVADEWPDEDEPVIETENCDE